METKAQKFAQIAAASHAVAIQKIRLLENLRSSDYESTTAQRTALVDELRDAVESLASAFGLVVRGDLENELAPRALTKEIEDPEDLIIRNQRVSERREIRAAVNQMYDGDIQGGVNKLRKIILAWPV